jgi:ABC-type lipoprotein release transport system permease subunit
VADRGDLAEVNRAAQELVGDGTIASSVGVAPVPRLSAGMLVVVAVVLVLGLVLSLGPAWRAGRLHPARTLRTE